MAGQGTPIAGRAPLDPDPDLDLDLDLDLDPAPLLRDTPVSPRMPSRRASLVFGVANLLTAAVVALGVFAGLPSRWAPVDLAALVLTALELASAAGLLLRAPWAARVSRVACASALALGLLAVTLLAVTASWLSGIYGPVGRGGAIVLALVAALALPYLVVLPVVQLVWLRPEKTP
jgi:hypothetical protein